MVEKNARERPTSEHDDRYQSVRVLENGIRNGKPLLIEDVHESIEPALEPVLAKAIFTEGARRLIRLGDSNVRRRDSEQKMNLNLTWSRVVGVAIDAPSTPSMRPSPNSATTS